MRRWMLAGGAAVVVVAALGLWWFQPWKLFTSKTVNEDVPAIAGSAAAVSTASSAAPSLTTPAAALLAEGMFITHEHATSGSAQLIRTADGSHQLILRDLITSDGPDLRVWLTDQTVRSGAEGWRVFDDGAYVELAPLKGNRGTQVYDIPATADVSEFRSVTIWCKRFAVSFGAAELAPAG